MNRKHSSYAVLLIAVLFAISSLAISCNQHEESTQAVGFNTADLAVAAETNEANPTEASTNRKLIREGSLAFETADAQATKVQIIEQLHQLKGYISKDEISVSNDQKEYLLTVRVPAENYDALLQGVEGLAVKIDYKTSDSKDVTEEFIDVEARVKSKKELELRYTELLKQAKTVTEILEIEREMNALREEIESIEGRLNFLQNSVSFSTLSLRFYEPHSYSSGFSSKIGQSLKGGWDTFLSFALIVLHLWPFILLTVGIIWLVKRFNRRRKNRKPNLDME